VDDLLISDTDNIPGKRIIKKIGRVKIEHDAPSGFQKHA